MDSFLPQVLTRPSSRQEKAGCVGRAQRRRKPLKNRSGEAAAGASRGSSPLAPVSAGARRGGHRRLPEICPRPGAWPRFLGESTSSARSAAGVWPAPRSPSLSVLVKSTGVSSLETPASARLPWSESKKRFRGKTCGSLRSLPARAGFPQESGVSPSSFQPSAGASPVPAARGAGPWVAAA